MGGSSSVTVLGACFAVVPADRKMVSLQARAKRRRCDGLVVARHLLLPKASRDAVLEPAVGLSMMKVALEADERGSRAAQAHLEVDFELGEGGLALRGVLARVASRSVGDAPLKL